MDSATAAAELWIAHLFVDMKDKSGVGAERIDLELLASGRSLNPMAPSDGILLG